MNRKDQDGTEEIILMELRQSLDRMDHVLDVPSILSKEQLKVHINKRWKRRRLSMMIELLIFWLVSLFVVGSGMLLAYSAPWILWVIQGISFVAAFVLVIHFIIHRRKEGIG
ncbi:YxlC family protein [Paenibacillus sp. FA6]|uniref:YxlC family protein n=1 Tax=Paenibacillus sp. FA6 TaxID=3413029 RepID=UPI003F65F494